MPNGKSRVVPAERVQLDDKFWGARRELARAVMLPYQWAALNDEVKDAEPSGVMRNFRIAAGLEQGEFHGWPFQDSDFAKWIEAVGHSLVWHPDAELERIADEAIDLVAAAQQPDGYLDTYYIINGLDKRFTNLMQNHELYCAGHLMEGAVAYNRGTGKDKLLRVACRFADCIDARFGPREGQLPGYPGHEVIEMALMELYRATGEQRYLRLAGFFLHQRGQTPLYFEEEMRRHGNEYPWADSPFGLQYYQAGLPVEKQPAAEGHAVRAVYLYCGMADYARETGDEAMLAACRRLWANLTQKRMYITGGIGSSAYGEAFTFDYDLPPDTAYAETCAAIGLVFFARCMLENELNSGYADVMERALYNGVLAGMSAAGTEFFYVNPLEVVPEACQSDHLRAHVKPVRQKWFGCACCPPNLARLLTSLGGYAATQAEDAVYLHLYLGGHIATAMEGVALRVESTLPWEGRVRIVARCAESRTFTLALRWPGWCTGGEVLLNGGTLAAAPAADGYLHLTRAWQDGDAVELHFAMQPQLVRANPHVRECACQVALTRGPLVYCLEERDNGPGLHLLRMRDGAQFHTEWCEDLGGYIAVTTTGEAQAEGGWADGALYAAGRPPRYEARTLRFLPYFLWANRGEGEMRVWLPTRE